MKKNQRCKCGAKHCICAINELLETVRNCRGPTLGDSLRKRITTYKWAARVFWSGFWFQAALFVFASYRYMTSHVSIWSLIYLDVIVTALCMLGALHLVSRCYAQIKADRQLLSRLRRALTIRATPAVPKSTTLYGL